MLDYKPNMVLSNQEYKVVGTRPIRPDGADKVTGKARYAADTNLPGLLFGRVLRSPHAHARIKSIDTSKAAALPGVRAVGTSADIVEPTGRASELSEGAMVNYKFLSNNVLATDKALYKGHAIAAVCASNTHIAEQALKLIEVEYEVLPPVMNAKDAMKADAPLLHDRLASMTTATIRAGGVLDDNDPTQGSNLANKFEFQLGDLEKGFAEADFIVEKETSTVAVHQGYIEAQNATAHWNNDGNITVWNSSQGTYNQRQLMAEILKHPVSQIKMVPQEIGGGFGGKIPVYLEVPAAMLS